MKRPDIKKPTIMYNYIKGGQQYSTPSVKIAVARRDEGQIQRESVLDGVSDISNLEIIN